MKKERIDVLLVDKGFFPSREKAQSALMAGLVLVDNNKIDKAGTKVSQEAVIRILGEVLPYVSRGGLKLEKALDVFSIDMKDKTVLDLGASTGGFTDCALQHGAKKVFAVDVGYGQLDWSLRNNNKVVCIERTNARYLEFEQIGQKVDFITMDLSFISLTKILSVTKDFLSDDGMVIALIKPQFEAGKDKIGKNGVVKDKSIHKEVIEDVIAFAKNIGFYIKGLDYSPIKGPKGNIEYLLCLSNSQNDSLYSIDVTINSAHLNML